MMNLFILYKPWIIKWGLFIFMFATNFSIKAQNIDELVTLSFDELLQVEVTTAGKTEQKITDIPTSIILISQSEIRRYGYKNVSDILKHVAGLYNHNIGSGNNFGIRGYWNKALNRNITVLINGIDIRNSYNDNNSISFVNIPVESITRIEFVKGPMATTYGNGAFFGALNIITKNINKTNNSSLVTITGGIENTGRYMLRTEGAKEDYTYAFNASYFHTDGSDFKYRKMTDSIVTRDGTFVDNASTNGLFGQDNIYGDFSGNFKDFYFAYIFSHSTVGFVSTLYPIQNEKPKTAFNSHKINFGYHKEFSDQLSIDANIKVNSDGYYFKDTRFSLVTPDYVAITNPVLINQHTYSWIGEVNTFINPTSNLSLSVGYYYHHIFDLNHFLQIPEIGYNQRRRYLDNSIFTHAPFAKIDFWIVDDFLLELGARVEQRKQYDFVDTYIDSDNVYQTQKNTFGDDKWSFTPNIALLYKINKQSFKAIYGMAVNQPTPLELINTPNQIQPQKIRSFELNYSNLFYSQLAVSANVFFNQLSDLIIVNRKEFSEAELNNSGLIKAKGSEIILTYRPNKKIELSGATTYQHTKDKSYEAEMDAAISPNWLGNLKVSYQITDNITCAATAYYVDEMEAIWNIATDTRAGNKVDSYININANIRIDNIPFKNLFINIRCTNLLSADIYYANSVTNLWYTNGMFDGNRYFDATVGYQF